MFRERANKEWNWSWGGIILVVLIAIAVIQLIRVNPPDGRVSQGIEKKVLWTEGTIVSGPLEIEAGGYLKLDLNFNRKVSIDGYFTTGDSEKRLACSIISAADFEKWRSGEQVNFVNNTGPVPRGFVRRVIEPGSYTLMFDNRMNKEKIRIVESNFEIK